MYDSVLDDLLTRGGKRAHAVVVINVEIRDNHEDAAVGGQHILELARTIEATPDIHDRFEGVVERFVEETGCNILYSLSYY